MHGSGSLTKYWAHLTKWIQIDEVLNQDKAFYCKWIVKLQNRALEIMKKIILMGGDLIQYPCKMIS